MKFHLGKIVYDERGKQWEVYRQQNNLLILRRDCERVFRWQPKHRFRVMDELEVYDTIGDRK